MVKMASFDIVPPPQAMSESSESPESSGFVVFSNPSSVSSPSNNFLINIGGATPDLSPEEVHQWLKELLRENVELKDALQRNNMMMEEQLHTVSTWREQMIQANNGQKIIIQEEQKLSQKLKEEIEKLRQNVQELEVHVKDSQDHHILECEALKADISGLQEELNECQKTKNNLQNELTREHNFQLQFEKSMQGISTDLDNLQSNSKLLEEEKRELTALNNQLQSELSRLNVLGTHKSDSDEPIVFNDEESGYAIVINPEKSRTYGDRKINAAGLKEILLNLQEEQFNVSTLTQQLAEEKVQVACLKKLLEERGNEILMQNEQTQTSEIMSIEKSNRDQNLQTEEEKMVNTAAQAQSELVERLREELELTNENLNQVTTYMQNYKDRCGTLQLQNEEFLVKLEKLKATDKVVIEQLQQDMKTLQGILHQERAVSHNERSSFVEARLALGQLSGEYRRVVNELQSLRAERQVMNEDQTTQKQSQQMKHLDQLDSLTAQLINSEQQLEEQQIIVKTLNQKIARIQEDSETIPILKAQVEVYKSDFESEKMAKEIIASKLEECEEIVKRLQVQLLNQQKSHGGRAGSSASKTESGLKMIKFHSSPRKQPGAEKEELSCPRCMAVFTKFEALRNHVDACIADDCFV